MSLAKVTGTRDKCRDEPTRTGAVTHYSQALHEPRSCGHHAEWELKAPAFILCMNELWPQQPRLPGRFG